MKRSLLTAAVASTAILSSPSAHAANGVDTWQGSVGSTDWATSGDWTTGSINKPPISGDSLTFTNAAALNGTTLTNTLTSGAFNIAGITFNSGAPSYTMTGYTFNLTSGITNNSGVLQTFSNTGGISDSGTGTQSFALGTGGITITNGLSFSGNANQTLGTNGSGTLTLGSLVINSGGSASTTLSIGTLVGAGTGNIVVNGAVSNGGVGNNAIKIQSGAVGTYTFAGNNTYTGGTSISAIGATLVLTGDNTLMTGTITHNTGTLDINSAKALGSTSGSTLLLNAGLAGLFANIDNTSGGVTTVGGPNIIVSQTFTYGGTNNLNLGASPVSLTLSNSIVGLMGSTSSVLTMGNWTNSTASGLSTFVNGVGHTLNLGGYTLSGTAATARTDTLTGSGNINITGAVSDVTTGTVSSNLVYSGAGTLTLGGANTYSGTTTVNSGTVNLTGSITPTNSAGAAITVNGGSFTESGTGVIGGTATTLVVNKGASSTLSGTNTYGGTTTVSTGGALNLDYSSAGASSTNIIAGGNTMILGGGTLTIKGTSAARTQNFGSTQFTANTSSNIVLNSNGAAVNLVLNSATALFRGAQSTVDFTLPTTGSVTTGAVGYAANGILVAGSTAATDTAYATVNNGATWASNVAGSIGAYNSYVTTGANYLAANNVDVTNGDSVSGVTVNTLRFNSATDSLALAGVNTVAAGGILITPNVNSAAITGSGATIRSGTGQELVIINDGATFNIGSIIANSSSGVSTLTAAGTGTTTLSGANTYSGATSVDSGTLVLAGSNSSAGTTSVYTGGTLQLGNTASNGGLASGLLTLSGGTLQAGVASVPTLTNAVNLASIGGTISGAQSLSLGTLTGQGNGTLTSSITGGNLTINTLNIGAATASGFTMTINGTGNTTLGTVNDFSGGVGSTRDNLTYAGSGTLTLSGANTYGGTTTVSGGTVKLTGSLPAGTSTTNALVFNGMGTFNYAPTVGTSQTLGKLTFNTGAGTVATTSSGQVLTFATALGTRGTGATGNFVIGDGSTPSATNGFVISGQATGFINGGTFFNGSNFAWYDAAGYVRGINYATDAAALTTTGTTTLPANGNGATALLYAQTTGQLTAQTTGTITTLNMAGTGTGGTNDVTLASSANLNITKGLIRSGNSGNAANITGGAGLTLGSSGGDFVINTAAVNDLLTINTAILDSNASIVKTGLGKLTLGTSEISTNFSSFYMDQGTLNVSQDSNFGVNVNAINFNAGTLQAGAANVSFNNLRVTNLGATGAGQTIDTQSNNMSFLGAIQGGGLTQVLTKTGTGSLTLAANNTYLSTTAVTQGTLNVTGAIAGPVTVSNGATLTGTGTTGFATISGGGNVNLQDGAIGTLTVGGLSTGNSGTPSSFSFDISTVAGVTSVDRIIDTGTLTLNGLGGTTITIGNLSGTSTLTAGSYALLTYTGVQQSLGNLSLLTTSLDSKNLSLTQTGDTIYLTIAASVTNGQYTTVTTPASLNVHANGGTTTLATTIANTGVTPQDSLNYSGITATASTGAVGAATGNTSGTLADGTNNSPGATQTFTASAAGNVTVSNTGTVTNAVDTGETPVGTHTGATINVFSGLSTWSVNGGGSWSTAGTGAFGAGANWGANQGAPGVTAGFANTDTATFNNSVLTPGNNATVTLDGATPSLKSITFNTQAGSGYTLAQGTGGSLALAGNGGNATVTVTSGTHTISAPVSLTTSADVNVASGQKITFSGPVSGGGGLNTIGAGATILSNTTGNSYTGGTSVTAGRLLVTNTSGSATGTGAVSVSGSTALLGGSGKISGAVTLSSGADLYSGATGTATTTNPGTGAVSGTTGGMALSSALNVNGASLTFALSNSASATFAVPALSTSYLTVGGTVSFTGADTINLVDLTNGGLSLRLDNHPYLLISGNAFAGLVIVNSLGQIGLSDNGFQGAVLGVSNGGLNPLAYTAFSFNQFGSDGVTPLSPTDPGNTTGAYIAPYLYLSNGNLEVVPEPGTWALMIGGLALLVVIQRRKGKQA